LNNLEQSSVQELEGRFATIITSTAKKFNLSLDAFENSELSFEIEEARGKLTLSDAYGSALNPAPVSPTFGSDPWAFLSSVILHTLATNQRKASTNQTYVVAPMLSLGK
jgi:Gly-Xaa carboxypeptidase